MNAKIVLFGLIMLMLHTAKADELRFESGSQQVGVLELYTSEGCSSCPPADRWLSTLTDHDGLWKQFIPVAFHVDYWDYIGWKDRFASVDHSRRQRRHASSQGMRTVYTPGFFFNGEEWRSWFARKLSAFPKGGRPGPLSISISNGVADITYQPTTRLNKPRIFMALLGFDLSTPVRAGENSGRTLQHDFVVLGVREAPLRISEGSYRVGMGLPESDISAPRTGLAVWVAEGDDPAPLQATGGLLDVGSRQ